MPNFALVTGSSDVPECILRKIGIADSEFTASSGTGRIKLFAGAGAPGASVPAITSETQLEASSAALNQFDMVMFACQGNEFDLTTATQQKLISYANGGGRVMATHFAYTWFFDDVPFSGTATWAVDPGGANAFAADPQTGYVNTTFPEGLQLAQWLSIVNASTTQGQVPLEDLRHDFTGVVAPSQLWLSVNDMFLGNVPMLYTFNTPVGVVSSNQCVRVEFNDFHQEFSADSSGVTFPNECTVGSRCRRRKRYSSTCCST